MAKYRKKPVEVDAVLWDGTNIKECEELLGEELDVLSGDLFIDGFMLARKGRFLILEGNDIYTLTPEEFEKTHEKSLGK